MSIVSFGLLVTLLVMMGLFFTESFRERVCAPLVRWLVARRRAAALRSVQDALETLRR